MNSSPTALFDSYEQDFQQIITIISQRFDKAAADENTERKATLRRLDIEIDEADEMLSQMEIEIQGIPQSIRVQYHGRLRKAKADLAQYKKIHKDQQNQLARSDLFSSPESTSDDPYGTGSDRARLLAGTSMLENGSRRLQESQRIALETEDQGAHILRNLRQQREQIENSRNVLHTADTSIDRASRTIGKMIRQLYKQRVVTGVIVFILLLLIGLIVWNKVT